MNEELCHLFRIPHRSAGRNERGIIACIADILPVPIRRTAVSKLLLRNQAIKRSRIQWRCERGGAKENPSVVVNEVTARTGRGGLCAIRVLDHTFVRCQMDRCGRQNEGGEGQIASLLTEARRNSKWIITKSVGPFGSYLTAPR